MKKLIAIITILSITIGVGIFQHIYAHNTPRAVSHHHPIRQNSSSRLTSWRASRNKNETHPTKVMGRTFQAPRTVKRRHQLSSQLNSIETLNKSRSTSVDNPNSSKKNFHRISRSNYE